MTEEKRYATPVALRAAINDRLRAAVAKDQHRTLQDLLRQFAYDRLLYRIFSSDDAGRWVLKGATALLARLHGDARHSIDVDLYDQAGSLDDAEAALRAAAARDVGDYFRLVLSPGRRIADAGVAIRISATAFIGATEFARFNVDLVAGTGMTGTPDEAGPLVPIAVPGVPQIAYRIYPLADHIADKILAIVERHARGTGAAISSTRYRDLVDLVVIARREAVAADALSVALGEQARRRSVDLPDQLRPPGDAAWRTGYARIARDLASLHDIDFDQAVETVSRFVDPVLQRRAGGAWAPEQQAWVDH